MSAPSTITGPAPVRCAYHPTVETLLRCSRCGKPICPKCGVRTPVGMRCPDCAGVAAQVLPLGIPGFMRALGFGMAVALPIAVVMGFAPQWDFYLGMVLGFASAETVARAVPGRRGVDMQIIAVVVVVIALLVSRYVTAATLGVSLADLDFMRPQVQKALYLRPMPDLVFAGIPILIAFFRFR